MAAQGIGLFANPAGAVVVAVSAIFLVVIIILFSGAAPSTVVGGELTPPPPTDSSDSPPGSDQPPLPPADIAEIEKYVNIGYLPNSNSNSKCFAKNNGVCTGAYAGMVLTDTEKAFIYNIFKKLFRSQRYKELLGTNRINLYFFEPLTAGYINGGAGYNNNDMAFFGYFRYGVADKFKYKIMIHESGHIIDKRNGNNELGMNLSLLTNADGAACYDYTSPPPPYYLKTYAYRAGEGGNAGAKRESFAEAIADNVICYPGYPCTSAVLKAKQIDNYPEACSETYKWIKTHVFGETDFFGLP